MKTKKATARLELVEYHDQASVLLPKYCRDLKIIAMCEDDLPVVYVLVEEFKEAA